MSVIVHSAEFDISLDSGPDIADITGPLSRIVAESSVQHGSIHVTCVGSTGSVTTFEYEPGAVEDLKRAISRLAPPDIEYAHEITRKAVPGSRPRNGHSHVQAALFGPSLVLPVRSGRIRLGTWQQVILINHDTQPRRRPVEVTVIGHDH